MLERLLVRLIGDGTSYQKMIDGAMKQTDTFVRRLDNVNDAIARAGQKMSSLGSKLTKMVTLPAAAIGGGAVTAFARFDQAMTESTSIIDVTDEKLQEMKDHALQLSTQAIQGPTELAKAYFYLASAGLDADKQMGALGLTADFATAGAFDMALATDLLTDAQSALGLSVEDTAQNMENMARVSDVLVKANTLANAKVQEFSEALTNQAAASLRGVNKDIEEGVAVLAAYADQGNKGMKAGSDLARVNRLLSKSAIENAAAHEELGLKVFDSNDRMRNYADIVEDLERILGPIEPRLRKVTMAQLGFGAEVQGIIEPLIGTSKKIREYEKGLREAGGTTVEVADNQMGSLINQLKLTRNVLSSMSIAFVDKYKPALVDMTKAVRALLFAFQKLSPAAKDMITQTIGLTTAIGPALFVSGKLITAMSGLASSLLGATTAAYSLGASLLAALGPIGVIIAVVVIAVGAIYAWSGSWENVGKVAWNALQTVVNGLIWLQRTFYIVIASLNRVFYRVFAALFGWMHRQFFKLFTQDFILAIMEAHRRAHELFIVFFKWVKEKFKALFTGAEVFDLADLLDKMGKDMRAGFQEDDLGKTITRILGEELDMAGRDLQANNQAFQARQEQDLVAVTPTENTLVKEATERGVDLKDVITKKLDEVIVVSKEIRDKATVEFEGVGL